MIAAGINDVFLSNEIVDPKKLKRLVELAKRPGVKLSCCVDNAAVIDSTHAIGLILAFFIHKYHLPLYCKILNLHSAYRTS